MGINSLTYDANSVNLSKPQLPQLVLEDGLYMFYQWHIWCYICDRPQDFSHFGDDTHTTHSHGKTKDAGVNTERPCQDFAH